MNKFALVTTCLLFASPVLAQSVGDKAQALGEKAGVNSMMGVSPPTPDFITKAAVSDMFEIKSSQLAAQRSDAATKSFANKMIADHEKTTKELKAAAAKVPGAVVPPEMDSSHQKMLDELSSLNGADFTKKYHDQQVSAHKDAVSLFDRYAKGGDNPTLKTWAGQTLPTLQDHLQMAEALDK
jgi:putative membrane protein